MQFIYNRLAKYVLNSKIYSGLLDKYEDAEAEIQRLAVQNHNLQQQLSALQNALEVSDSRPLYRNMHRRIAWQRKAITALERRDQKMSEHAWRKLIAAQIEDFYLKFGSDSDVKVRVLDIIAKISRVAAPTYI